MCRVFALILVLDQTIRRLRHSSLGKYILRRRRLTGIGRTKRRWLLPTVDLPAGIANLSLKTVPSLDPILGTLISTTRASSKYMKASQVRQTYRNTCSIFPITLNSRRQKAALRCANRKGVFRRPRLCFRGYFRRSSQKFCFPTAQVLVKQIYHVQPVKGI
jgi:hypothetical protein